MPSPRRVPTDVHRLIASTLGLYEGLFAHVRIETLYAVSLPAVRLDPDQIRRVVINLVDNAIEALNQQGLIVVETQHAAAGAVRIIIADDGPGIAPEERDKLFMPYYSTKKRGSGLGLAIVRRIVAEHGGVGGGRRQRAARHAGSPSSCRAARASRRPERRSREGIRPDRRRRAGRPRGAGGRAARRGLRGRRRRQRGSLPRSAHAGGVRRHPARHLAARHRRARRRCSACATGRWTPRW